MKPTRTIEKAKHSSRSYRRKQDVPRIQREVGAYNHAEASTSSNAGPSTSSHVDITNSGLDNEAETSIKFATPKMEVEFCIASLQSEGLRETTVRNYTPAMLDWKVSCNSNSGIPVVLNTYVYIYCYRNTATLHAQDFLLILNICILLVLLRWSQLSLPSSFFNVSLQSKYC
jgi:hypothetical protein